MDCVLSCGLMWGIFKQSLHTQNHSLTRSFHVADIVYDLDALEEHGLLNQLGDWDFPIFDLYNDMGDRILSQVCWDSLGSIARLVPAVSLLIWCSVSSCHLFTGGIQDFFRRRPV